MQSTHKKSNRNYIELKSTLPEVKHSLCGLKNRLEIQKKWLINLKTRLLDIIQS